MKDVAEIDKAEETLESLWKLKYKTLQALAKSRLIRANLSKPQLIKHLLASKVQNAVRPVDSHDDVGKSQDSDRSTVGGGTEEPAGNFQEGSDNVQENVGNDVQKHNEETAEEGMNVDITKEGKCKTTFPTKSMVKPDLSASTEEVPEGEFETLQRLRRDGLSALKETRLCGTTPRVKDIPTSISKRTTAGTQGRFSLAHHNLFASQVSIERYGKTPKKNTGAAIKKGLVAAGYVPSKTEALVSTPARPVTSVFGFGVKSAKRKQAENPVQPKMSAFTSKPKAPVGTPSRPVTSESGHGVVTSANQGTTVASRPCSLVVQPSSKKPTQVKEFRLSSNNKREAFTFKPYSGPVRPFTPGVQAPALVDKTNTFNAGIPEKSTKGSQQLTNKPFHPDERLGIKTKLASSRAQEKRRTAHAISIKKGRENKVAKARLGRS